MFSEVIFDSVGSGLDERAKASDSFAHDRQFDIGGHFH
jgi:hypothetical protein